MMCAVRFSADQLFYRAEILNVVDSNNIEVKYVDYGNIEAVSVYRIRKLLDVYTVLTVQVCFLILFHWNFFPTELCRNHHGAYKSGKHGNLGEFVNFGESGKFQEI